MSLARFQGHRLCLAGGRIKWQEPRTEVGVRGGTRGWWADHNADLLVQSSRQAFRSHPTPSRARRFTPSKCPPHEGPLQPVSAGGGVTKQRFRVPPSPSRDSYPEGRGGKVVAHSACPILCPRKRAPESPWKKRSSQVTKT